MLLNVLSIVGAQGGNMTSPNNKKSYFLIGWEFLSFDWPLGHRLFQDRYMSAIVISV